MLHLTLLYFINFPFLNRVNQISANPSIITNFKPEETELMERINNLPDFIIYVWISLLSQRKLG